jgi:hypothetical protein
MDSDFKKELSQPLSDLDIRRFFKDEITIRRYREIQTFDNLFDVIGPYERCILLFESTPLNHWVIIQIIRKSGRKPYVLMTDSYGLIPTAQFNYIPKAFQKLSHQDKKVLLDLLINQPLEVHYSPYKLQKISRKISTCGKHCCVRGLFNTIDEDDYAECIKMGLPYGISTDELICILYDFYKN